MQFWQGLIDRYFRLFFTTSDLVTQWVYKVSKGALGHNQAGYKILLLTTIGRRSGKERTHALLYLKVEENWIVVASNGGNLKHPDWYFNLLHQPQAKIQVGKFRYKVEARTVSDEERSILWQLLVKVWPAYANYQAGIQREIPIIVLKQVIPTMYNGIYSVLHREKSYVDVVKSPVAKNLIKEDYVHLNPSQDFFAGYGCNSSRVCPVWIFHRSYDPLQPGYKRLGCI